MNGNRGLGFDLSVFRRRRCMGAADPHGYCGDPACSRCYPYGGPESAEDEDYLRSEEDRAHEERLEAQAEDHYLAERRGE